MRVGRLSCIVYLFFLVAFGKESLAIPSYEQTVLPFPTNFNEADKSLIGEALKLEVYKDSVDPNQYYYVPPFHIRQYQRGAAAMVLHTSNIRNYAAATKEMDERSKYFQLYNQKKIEELKKDTEKYEAKVQLAKEKLAEAIEKNIKELISLREEFLKQDILVYEKSVQKLLETEELIKNGGNLLPPILGRAYFERALLHIASMGAHMNNSASEDPNTLTTAINSKLEELSNSYGGFISVNVYGGFKKAQLEALAAYRAKYFPAIKVSLLPIEKLTFFSLTEFQKEHGNKASKLLGQIQGSGDYLGAALVLDATIAGSEGLAKHMAPFVLPVGIKATFKQQLMPTEAELNCDFSDMFEVKGRADVRDGLVIYDNDITNTISSSDSSLGACSIKLKSGDPSSAHFAALRALEKKYDELRLQRTILNQREKKAYVQGVLDDIQNNRRQGGDRYFNVYSALNPYGWFEEVVVEAFSSAADFHWHTSIQNVNHLSSVKFNKKISITGHQTAEKSLAPNFCLIFNTALQAYDRCVEVEEGDAKSMSQSSQDASATCPGASDPYECAQQRDSDGKGLRKEFVPVKDDDQLSQEI